MKRRGALTVDVTVSSFSSYVGFLEGYARALVSAETRWDRARTWLREAVRSARGPMCARARATAPAPALSVSFPGVRSDRDIAKLAQEVFALPPGWPPSARAGRRRARRIPGDRRLQRRLGRTRAARRGAAPAGGRLRVRRIGTEPDGTDAHAEAALLQGRPGDAAGEDSGGRIRRRSSKPGSPSPGFAPEAGLGAAVVDLAGNLPYDVQRLAHETWDEVRAAAAGGARRSTTCTRRCAVCWPNSRRCSRPCGSG